MIALLAEPLRAQRRWLRLASLCAALAALAGVGLLAVSGWFLAGAGLAGMAGIAAVQGFNYLLPSAAIRAAAIVRTGARHGERLLGHRAALYALADLRRDLFALVARAALAGRDPGRSGVMANRLGRDVDALEDAVIRRVGAVGAAVAAGAGLLAAGVLGWRAVLVMVLALGAMRGAGRWMAGRLLPEPVARAAQALAAMQGDYADLAGPAADIAVYGLAGAMAAALDAHAAQHDAATRAVVRGEAAMAAAQLGLAGLALAVMAVLSHGTAPWLALGLLGSAAAFEGWGALTVADMRRDAVAQAQARLDALADATTDATGHQGAALVLSPRPALAIAGQALAPGARVQLVGPSGAGKTRVLETLAGLRDDAPQDLRVDGHDPRELGLAVLRTRLTLAAQPAPLIAGSVADNLRLARPGVDDAAMWRALHVACADDVVRGLPDGLDQWLGGDGARLSGGQRRRIALARALLAGRPWLLLDEPGEGLDAATLGLMAGRLGIWLDQTGTGLVLVSHRPALDVLVRDRIVLQQDHRVLAR